MSHANKSSFPTVIPLYLRRHQIHLVLLIMVNYLHVSVYGFTQLSVVDQRQMIEQMLSMNEVKGIVIETPAEADEKDFRMKTFTELFDKLPQLWRVVFFQSELVCWFRHLHSNDQQELIENMYT